MTRKELLSLPHLKIAEVVTDKFVHVHTEDGYFITDYIEGDIKKFNSCVCMYMPIMDNYKDYRVIDKETNDKYAAEQREAIEKEMKAERNKDLR